MKDTFTGKVAFVTGAGTGIGRATAVAFARECRSPDYVAYFCSNSLAHRKINRRRTSRLTDDEVLSGSLHHVDRELAEAVDLDDPLHLRQQTCEQAEVPAGEPGDRRRHFWRDIFLGSATPVGAQ